MKRLLLLFLTMLLFLAGCAGSKTVSVVTEEAAAETTPLASEPAADPEPSLTQTPTPTLEPPDPLEPLRALFDDREGPADEKGVTVEYNVYSPVKGAEDGEKYPVMIWIHGMGQGLESRMPLYESEVVKFASEDYQRQFVGENGTTGAYVVVPRANEDDGEVMWGFYTTNSWMADSNEDGVSDQLPALQNAIHQFLADEAGHVDLNRIYLGGFSAGGYMTWQMLLSEPDLFAAAYPICPAYAPSVEELETVRHVPIWMISGKLDPTVSFAEFVAPVWERLQQTSESEIRLSAIDYIFEGDGKTPVAMQHFAWVAVTNNMLFDDGTPYDAQYPEGFLPWLSAQSK